MRPSAIGRLSRAVRLTDPVPYLSVPRCKGGRLAAIPLVDDAVAAAHDFIGDDAFGPWSTQSANRAIHAAARKAGHEPFTVYQIRHSFATWLRHAGADLTDIPDLYGHTDAATARVYAAPTLSKDRDRYRVSNFTVGRVSSSSPHGSPRAPARLRPSRPGSPSPR